MAASYTPRKDLSQPLLPSVNATAAQAAMAKRPKAMSYPFSQVEVIAEATVQSGLSKSDNEAFEHVGERLRRLARVDVHELLASAQAVESARASVYKRTRPESLDVPEEGPSWKQVAMTIATVLVGAGVLSLPYAMRNAGFGAGLFMIFGSTAIASYTAKMLVWSFNELNERKSAAIETGGDCGKGFVATYDQLSEEIGVIFFGETGGAIAGTLMKALTVLECYGCAVCYVVLHATSWPEILEMPEAVFHDLVPAPVASVSVWALLMAPLMLIKVRHLAVFGSLGLVAIASLLVVSVAAPALNAEPAPSDTACAPLDSSVHATDIVGERSFFKTEGLGVALGLVLFCFGGHATLPDIYARMDAAERPHFDKAVNVGCAAAGALYALLGVVGYQFYGECAADQLTLNLMHSSSLLGRLATTCILANTFLTFPNFCAPVVRILTEALHSADAVASLEADVVPLTEEQLYRSNVSSQLDAINTKVDALGAVLTALAKSQSVKLPMEAVLALRSSPARSQKSADTSSVGSAELAGALKREAEEAAAAAADAARPSALFEAMSTRSLLIRLALVVGAAFLAVSVPNFGFVVALMGAFTTMLVSFILPTAFYMAVHYETLSKLHAALCAAVVLLGFAGMAIGLSNTLSGEM